MQQDAPALLATYAAGDYERSVIGWWCALVSCVC